MAINVDIKERIFAAADQLHAESPTGEFPGVEAVRQLSRAGMNNVVEAMKEWRQRQRKQVQSIKEPIPTSLQTVLAEMGQNMWATALQLANESLESAKAAFEAEKTDLVELSAQQSEAFERQASHFERAKAELGALRADLAEALARAERAEAKVDEIERRAADLRSELDRAYKDLDHARTGLAEQLQAAKDASDERDVARAELLKAETAAEVDRRAREELRQHMEIEIAGLRTELDRERGTASEAREKFAGMEGQLVATQTQMAALLDRLNKSS